MKYGVCHLSVVPCRLEPFDSSEMVTQLLFGETVKVYEEKKKSWRRAKTAYDDYDCCYLQKPEFTAVSVGIKENGVFNGWTNPFEPDAVAYYTASPTETATSDFKSLGGFISGELFGETQFL